MKAYFKIIGKQLIGPRKYMEERWPQLNKCMSGNFHYKLARRAGESIQIAVLHAAEFDFREWAKMTTNKA